MIYLDYAANTPVDEEVLKSFVDATRTYTANPNSSHAFGICAKKRIEEASKIIASYFGMNPEGVIYTSGSSESNNLVLKGIAEQRKKQGNKIIISAVEHSSIVAPCNYLTNHGFDIAVIPLDKSGKVDLKELEKEIDDNTILVSICAVDSELGTIQPIEKIAEIVKKNPNILFHTDATQAIGKVEIDYSNVDFITFAPHKFFGLNGFGVLLNRNNVKLTPLIHGGKSTTIFRSGTPVTANVVALETAFVLATSKLKERSYSIQKLNQKLRNAFDKIDSIHINSPKDAIFNTLNISLIGKDTKKILKGLEKEQIYLSTTTACSLGNTPSKSVFAITGSEELASNTIRISISHLTTDEEIDTFIKKLKQLLQE